MFSPVPVSSFRSHVEWLSRPLPSGGGADGFDAQLDALSDLQCSPSALAQVYAPTAVEQHKNRYCDVLPNCASRIRLRTFEGCYASDYVNASLVSPDLFPFPAQPYIAAQAPLSACVADFWAMAWEQRCELVVMLTKERERAKDDSTIRKADRYWPNSSQQPLTLGPLTIELAHTIPLGPQLIQHAVQQMAAASATHELASSQLTAILLSCQPTDSASSSHSPSEVASGSSLHSADASACSIVIRELVLSCGGERRCIRQLHYIGWPDHGVPSDLPSFASLLLLYRSLRSATPRTAPVIVHCSAGIGRTGTFCTIDLALDQLAHAKQQQHSADATNGSSYPAPLTASTASQPVDAAPPQTAGVAAVSVANLVRLLRVSRGGMVQTKGQYQFCYRFLDFVLAHPHYHALLTQQQRLTTPAAEQPHSLSTQNGNTLTRGG